MLQSMLALAAILQCSQLDECERSSFHHIINKQKNKLNPQKVSSSINKTKKNRTASVSLLQAVLDEEQTT